MRRLLAIWLTLLAAFWLTRAVVSALLFERADLSWEGFLQLALIPLLQTLALGWLTRAPERETPDRETPGEERPRL
jgi:hypothetical protein